MYSKLKEKENEFKKDEAVMISNFDAATKLMRNSEFKNLNLRQRMNLFFIDYNLIPLLFHENYLNTVHKDQTSTESLEKLVRATNSVAEADTISKHIRTNMDFKLLDAYGFKSTIYPANILCDGIGFVQFPEFFGKFSTTKKIYRELRELRIALNGHITGSRQSVKSDYAPTFMKIISHLMKDGQKEDLEEVLKLYESYSLDPNLVKEHLVEIIYNPEKVDLLQNVDKKTKTAMTKLYNAKYKESLVRGKGKKK